MHPKLGEVLSQMTLSASGWRGVFAENGDEESAEPEISPAHRIIAAVAAKVFSDYTLGKGAIIVGKDTRPTGDAITDVVIRALLSEERELRYTGVTAAPEIMAYARKGASKPGSIFTKPAAGFIYISASHNPIGHNGIKFGLTDGGVLQAGENLKLVSDFKSFLASPDAEEKAGSLLRRAGMENLASVYAAANEYKKAAISAYRDFTGEVISGQSNREKREGFFALLKEGLEKRPLGIVADFNGSARAASIDRDFLSSLGIKFYALNEIPGKISHRIVPEGESLETCRAFVEEQQRKDPSVILGYMPDCDGDRGNLVFWKDKEQQVEILEAQEVFALSCLAELSFLVWTGELKPGKTKTAIAVNDATSMRIDRIAEAFGTSVFRAETGEANVVGLARKLREQGYLVRILGEGSNGGSIIYPSAVRDPINTLGAIIKLLAIRRNAALRRNAAIRRSAAIRKGAGTGQNEGLFEIWCKLTGKSYLEDFTLADIIAALPAFFSTGAYTDESQLKIKTSDHGFLKDRYQKIFISEWEEKKKMLNEDFGIIKWEALAYNGSEEKRDLHRFGESGRGGLKIGFTGKDETTIASIWMRGSATEPVFRVMADAESQNLERFLIKWQRTMVLEAAS